MNNMNKLYEYFTKFKKDTFWEGVHWDYTFKLGYKDHGYNEFKGEITKICLLNWSQTWFTT